MSPPSPADIYETYNTTDPGSPARSHRIESDQNEPPAKRTRLIDRGLRITDLRVNFQLYAGALIDNIEEKWDTHNGECCHVLGRLFDLVEQAHPIVRDDTNAVKQSKVVVGELGNLY